jgi:hypothetical protein
MEGFCSFDSFLLQEYIRLTFLSSIYPFIEIAFLNSDFFRIPNAACYWAENANIFRKIHFIHLIPYPITSSDLFAALLSDLGYYEVGIMCPITSILFQYFITSCTYLGQSSSPIRE